MLFLVLLVSTPMVASWPPTPTPPPPTTVPPGCVHEGKWYDERQQFRPTPCEFCHCEKGQPVCLYGDCFITLCVDAVHDPSECCPRCPNGPNCYGPNKQIIPADTDFSVDPYTVCRCTSGSGFLQSGHAVCKASVTTVPPP